MRYYTAIQIVMVVISPELWKRGHSVEKLRRSIYLLLSRGEIHILLKMSPLNISTYTTF